MDYDGEDYFFVHDSVKESAYGLIQDEKRFQFDLGMTLLGRCKSQVKARTDVLFAVLKQVNCGMSSLLCDESQRIIIARLNYEAGSQVMQRCNYTSAYTYTKTAASLLPENRWDAHHDLSIAIYFQLAKTAYSHSYSKTSEARGKHAECLLWQKNWQLINHFLLIDALNEIIIHAKSLEIKLDAYTLLHLILFSACAFTDMSGLLVTVIDVLKSLGEDIPEVDVAKDDLSNQVNLAKQCFESETDDTLLQHTNISKRDATIMQAYHILTGISYMVRPKLYHYYGE